MGDAHRAAELRTVLHGGPATHGAVDVLRSSMSPVVQSA
jgi:hypothetical protein